MNASQNVCGHNKHGYDIAKGFLTVTPAETALYREPRLGFLLLVSGLGSQMSKRARFCLPSSPILLVLCFADCEKVHDEPGLYEAN